MGEWIVFGKPWDDVNYDDDGNQTIETFKGLELNKPGTLVEFANGRQMIIGHINKNSGRCDCCSYDHDEAGDGLVVRYMVLWQEPCG